jgi:peptidyl-prolyl cis-trans isomerase D
MLSFLRKHQKALFLIVAVVGIAFFVFPDSRSTSTRFSRTDGKGMNVLGTRITPEEMEAIRASAGILQSLSSGYNFADPAFQQLMRMNGLAARMAPMDEREPTAIGDFLVNTALCRVLARQLGVSVSEAEVNERIQELPKFQKDGKFDPVAWKSFIDAFGGEGGTRRKAIYEALGDSVLFDKIFALVGQPIPPSQTEIDLAYAEENQRVTASVFTFAKKDFENQEVSEEEMRKYFDDPKNKDELLSEERRAFRYALISKPKEDELKDLDEGKKAEKLKEHKRLAANFADKLVAEDRGTKTFDELAKELNLEVKTTEPFARSSPPEPLKGKEQLVHVVFNAIEVGATDVPQIEPDGYYAIELTAIEKPKPLEFEAAKERISKKLKETKQTEKLAEAIKTAREKLEVAIKGGKSLAEAATEAGLPAPRELPVFSRRKPVAGEPNFNAILQEAAKTDIGAISNPVPVPDGQLLMVVAKKELPKDPKMEDQKKALVSQRMAMGRQPMGNAVFNAWFTKMRDLADAGLTRK